MVSGFLTSPWLHCRMSSAVARPIRSSSNTLTSSKIFLPSLAERVVRVAVPPGARDPPWRAPLRGDDSDFFDRAGLEPAGQVDAEFLGGAVDVVVGVAHLDRGAVTREHLDVQAQRLQFLEQHLERLGDAG